MPKLLYHFVEFSMKLFYALYKQNMDDSQRWNVQQEGSWSLVMSLKFKGIAASPGIAVAKAYRLTAAVHTPVPRKIEQADLEVERFRDCVQQAKREIISIRDRVEQRLGAGEAEIFESHLLFLEDPELLDAVEDLIQGNRLDAASALHEVSGRFIQMLQAMNNELLRERAADLQDVIRRVLCLLRGENYSSVAEIEEACILVCEDLSPSDMALLNTNLVKGLITAVGSRTSHTVIMARTLGIPAIVGLGTEEAEVICAGDWTILDALSGTVLVSPNAEELGEGRRKLEHYYARKAKLALLRTLPTETADGISLKLTANVGSAADIRYALEQGAEGIGLFRTEFLFMERNTLPTEEEQFQIYKHALKQLDGKPVVIRTLDIGGDKSLPYMTLPVEGNPFLGLRAIRLSLEREELFRTQLRALLRASCYGQLKIMFPMVAVLEELRRAKRMLSEEKERLLQTGEGISDRLEVGIMIETPAAAISAEVLAREVDFFSIGTNDLIQYTMAADRMNEAVSYLYQPCHPSILKLIKMVVHAANQAGIPVSMCGEMAAEEKVVPLLIGLGLQQLSMSAGSILRTRELIRGLHASQWRTYSETALGLDHSEDVIRFVKERLRGENE